MLDMIALILGEDQDVVKVNKNKPIDHVSKHAVDECLEDRRGVRKAKRHDQLFKMPGMGVKGGLPFVPLPNPNQVISIAEVKLRKDGRPLQELKGRGHQRQRITIIFHDVIQPPIVYTGAQ